jgi:hypothetical protein
VPSNTRARTYPKHHAHDLATNIIGISTVACKVMAPIRIVTRPLAFNSFRNRPLNPLNGPFLITALSQWSIFRRIPMNDSLHLFQCNTFCDALINDIGSAILASNKILNPSSGMRLISNRSHRRASAKAPGYDGYASPTAYRTHRVIGLPLTLLKLQSGSPLGTTPHLDWLTPMIVNLEIA